MKVIEIVTSYLLLVVLCVHGLLPYEIPTADVTRTKEDEGYTKLFDAALEEYKNIIRNHNDRTVPLDDVTVSFETKLKKYPEGEVQLFNGSLRDLYTLKRMKPAVVLRVDNNHVLASAMFMLDHFFLRYSKYVATFGNMTFSYLFVCSSFKNYIRISWNVTLGPTRAVDLYRVELEAVSERVYFMPDFGRFLFMDGRAGKVVVDRFFEYEKYKVEDAIKRHFKEAVIKADIANLVKDNVF